MDQTLYLISPLLDLQSEIVIVNSVYYICPDYGVIEALPPNGGYEVENVILLLFVAIGYILFVAYTLS